MDSETLHRCRGIALGLALSVPIWILIGIVVVIVWRGMA